jgi:hypothetical protein
LFPQSPGDYVSGPNGREDRFGMMGLPRPFAKGGDGAFMHIPGALVGRIGENGTPFFMGADHAQVPQQEGNLFLHIVPSDQGAAATGSYQVKVHTGRFAD